MTDRADAVDTLLADIDQLVECVEAAESEKDAWECLTARVPAIAEAMTFNTFRMRAATMARTWKAAMARVASERTYSMDIQPEPERDIQQDIQTAHPGKGFSLAGWYVQPGKDGFYRGYKKMGGRTRCIYVGKDPDKAQERIQAWEGKQG